MCPGKPVNCGLQESKGDTVGGKGEIEDGRRGLVGRKEEVEEERDSGEVKYNEGCREMRLSGKGNRRKGRNRRGDRKVRRRGNEIDRKHIL